MPLPRPTLTQLREQVRDDLNANLPGADSRLKRGVLRVIGDIQAALVHMLYGYLAAMFKQCLPDTATGWFLERWANWFGLQRKAASFARGAVEITATPGTTINAGVELTSADGALYSVVAGVSLDAGNGTVDVVAKAAGKNGNADPGTLLQFVAAVAGVDGAAVVAASALAGGADEENDDALRARLKTRIAEPPDGGSAQDYRVWALEVPGVTRAWEPASEQGVGSVVLRFMMDDVRSDNNGIPQGDGAPDHTGDLALVADYIATRRPVTADVFVVAPVPVPLDLTISGLTPDTPQIRQAVAAEIESLLLREAGPGVTLRLSNVYEAISLAAGERHHIITSPLDDVTHAAGQIAVPGTLTFVDA